MSNKCPDCNLFVAMDTAEPEEGQFEITASYIPDPEEDYKLKGVKHIQIVGDIMLDRTCAECGTPLKTGAFSFNHEEGDDGENNREELAWAKGHEEGDHDLEVEVESCTVNERTGEKKKGRNRWAPLIFDVEIGVDVNCSCGAKALTHYELKETLRASEFEDLN